MMATEPEFFIKKLDILRTLVLHHQNFSVTSKVKCHHVQSYVHMVDNVMPGFLIPAMPYINQLMC